MNDRQRVESAIIPALIYAVVKNMDIYQKSEKEVSEHKFITDTAYQAYYREPVTGLMPNHVKQLHRRIDRIYRQCAPILNEHTNGKCMMMLYYMLEGLIQEGRLTIYDGTDFARAMELFLEPIQYLFNEQRLDASAQKQASRLMDVIKREGYFN